MLSRIGARVSLISCCNPIPRLFGRGMKLEKRIRGGWTKVLHWLRLFGRGMKLEKRIRGGWTKVLHWLSFTITLQNRKIIIIWISFILKTSYKINLRSGLPGASNIPRLFGRGMKLEKRIRGGWTKVLHRLSFTITLQNRKNNNNLK